MPVPAFAGVWKQRKQGARSSALQLPSRPAGGFWLARWLRARGIEAYVIHASSVAVSREYRRAKTDRLDTELLKRSFLGWPNGPALSLGVFCRSRRAMDAEWLPRRMSRNCACLRSDATGTDNRQQASTAQRGRYRLCAQDQRAYRRPAAVSRISKPMTPTALNRLLLLRVCLWPLSMAGVKT
jgi:hypothetical protein